MRHHFCLLTVIPLVCLFAGCASSGSTSNLNRDKQSNSLHKTDFAKIVRELGPPIHFDSAYSRIHTVPQFKDEFETSTDFTNRQTIARTALPSHFLIHAPLDFKYIKYDADRQILAVEIYAISNTSVGFSTLQNIFGYGSDLYKTGFEADYSFDNIAWALPYQRINTGTYNGSNAFGANVIVTKQMWTLNGVFEREANKNESVWFKRKAKYVKGSPQIIFEIEASPDEAKSFKNKGLKAAILVEPKFPFYATGTDHFSPTIRAPYDRTTEFRFIIGDIQCAAIYDADGNLLKTSNTQ